MGKNLLSARHLRVSGLCWFVRDLHAGAGAAEALFVAAEVHTGAALGHVLRGVVGWMGDGWSWMAREMEVDGNATRLMGGRWSMRR